MVGLEPGVVVSVWNDDSGDGFVEPFGQRWTFLDPAPDRRLGGAVNTRQYVAVYGPDWFTSHWDGVEDVSQHDWSEWPTPIGSIRHGVWVDDVVYGRAKTVRRSPAWMEWVT
jgi:hypothetical protein